MSRPPKNWRAASGRRWIPTNAEAPEEEKPPAMSRSRVQLATAYAPDRLFTWEGGRGICRSTPVESSIEADLAGPTKAMIIEGMREVTKSWRERAWQATGTGGEPHIELILDPVFYDPETGEAKVDGRRDFTFTSPDKLGYVPYPLLYRCGACGQLREFHNVGQQAAIGLPVTCGDHTARWTQVDVVYVHWSGGLQPLSPFHFRLLDSGDVRRLESCTCGSRDFRLDMPTPTFGDWRFVCLGCKQRRELRQPDPDTLRILKPAMDRGDPNQWFEINMLPVSYRANAAFYPQRGYFIELPDHPEVLELLAPDLRQDLAADLARLHRFQFAEPSDVEVEAAVLASDTPHEWDDFQTFRRIAQQRRAADQVTSAQQMETLARNLREGWVRRGLVRRGELNSPALMRQLDARGEWARRYDPIRLALEHAAFLEEHVEAKLQQHTAVDLMAPDRDLTPAAADSQALHAYQQGLSARYAQLGLERMVLIRGLPICEYTFGYSRVSADPIYHRNFSGQDYAVPVRLNAFSRLPTGLHPIYALEQNNEALYVRLDPNRVAAWLSANGVADVPAPEDLGAAYLERYADFGPFLEAFRTREGGVAADRELPPLVYLLLHTLAHQMVHAVSDLSGLDRSGIGEHLFPADLSFVVYRKGMTPDLGNISAMWRNHSHEFLERLVDPRMLRCGSGSLCDHRGGACPSCVMTPDVVCIASNQLLSRAALRGGAPPGWEARDAARYVGYFDPALRAG